MPDALLDTSASSILFLAHRVPYPPNRGDRIRSFHLLRFLAERAVVDLGFLAHEPVEDATRTVLEGLCRRVAWASLPPRRRLIRGAWSLATGGSVTEGAFHSRPLRRTLAGWAAQTPYDFVLVFCSSMVQYLSVFEPGRIPEVLVDLVDVDSQKWLDYAARAGGLKRWLFRLEARRLRQLERSLPARSRAILLVSQAEAELYRQVLGNGGSGEASGGLVDSAGPICAVANGVDLDYFRPSIDSGAGGGATVPCIPYSCVFVGALDYGANLDGLEWFCENVWSEVRRCCPGAHLNIVGSNPGPAAHRLAKPDGVQLVGAVPDVRPYLASAAAVVVPLRVARGIQNKVLEAMAMGRPVVASPGALEGLSVQAGVHAIQADLPSEWVATLIRLLADPAEQARLAAAGREYVECYHSWDHCLEPLNQLLGQPGGPTPSPARPAARGSDPEPRAPDTEHRG